MKALDFNSIQQPTWTIKLKDAEQSEVNLTTPTVELVDRLTAVAPELQQIADKQDGSTIRAVYELIADIMSCNNDGLTFTAEELRDKYKLSLLDVFVFVAGYLEFIAEIKNAKN